MKEELEELQAELKELEKDEIPTRMAEQAQSAKKSLETIDQLRSFMHKMVDSSAFQDLESRQNLDLRDVLEKAYNNNPGAAQEGKNQENLKFAIQSLLSNNVAKMQPEIIKDGSTNNDIELFLKVDEN